MKPEGLSEKIAAAVRDDGNRSTGMPLSMLAEDFPRGATFELVDLDLLFESKLNPRQNFEHLEELAESIAATQGLLTPMLVRPAPGNVYEIVDGARRYRALQLLAQRGVFLRALVDVRNLTNAQVAEAMMAADQRESLLPLEQAFGYRNMSAAGWSVEEMAASLGVSTGTVHGRLNLLRLGKRAMGMLEKGILPATVASALGRYPEELQAAALDEMLSSAGEGTCWVADEKQAKTMNARACVDFLQQNFTKSLKSPPFDAKSILYDDPEVKGGLLPECAKCPANSKNLPREVAGPDVHGSKHGFCTKPPCFESKMDQAMEAARERAKEEGAKVLTAGQSAKAVQERLKHDGAYVGADEVVHEDPKKRTWRQMVEAAHETLGDEQGESVRKVIAFTEHGRVDLFDRAAALEALAAADVKWAAKKVEAPTPVEVSSKLRDRAKTQKGVAENVLSQYVTRLLLVRGVDLEVLRTIVNSLDDASQNTKECALFTQTSPRALQKWIDNDATAGELFAVLYFRTMHAEFLSVLGGYSDEMKRAAGELKIDLRRVEKVMAKEGDDAGAE